MKHLLLVATLSVTALLIACTSNQIITSITLAVDAAEVALPIVTGATGVNPALITQLENYLAAVGQGLSVATDIIGKNEPPAQQAADITAAFAGVALPTLPAGLPVAIVTAVEKVSMLVSQFLANLPTAQGPGIESPYVLAFQKQKKPVKLSDKDREKLKKLHDRAAKLAAAKKK